MSSHWFSSRHNDWEQPHAAIPETRSFTFYLALQRARAHPHVPSMVSLTTLPDALRLV